MFIPLTNSQRLDGLPNVLIAGDTAGIFYLLGHMAALELNVFLADTGICRPLREFPAYREARKDRASVYYDFFDGGIGAGIPRRMDAVLTTSCDLRRWTRHFQVPAIHLLQDPRGTLLEFEGVAPRPEGSMGSMLGAFLADARHRYVPASFHVLLEKDGGLHAYPSVEKWACRRLAPAESTLSAWDRASDLLKPGETLAIGEEVIDAADGRRLIEAGVPELDVVAIECRGREKYVELTGDLARAFDGLF